MKKIILILLALILLGGAGYFTYQNTKASAQNGYYKKLSQECQQKSSPDCCLSSLEAMKKDNAHKINPGDMCSYGYEKEMLNCADSFAWCKPLSINETSKDAFYQSLRDRCKSNDFKSCCLDSVKAMEVVGATKLLAKGEDSCRDGLERMTLRCPGSYIWCQTLNNPEGEDYVPVPMDTPRIEPNHPEIPGPGFDNDGNGPICTTDAKQCPDGTYVGRTGPNCEFAKCPGKPLKSDTQPIDNLNTPIKLPNNVISEKDCIAAGGEVWNTLGQTSYNGELIGRVEGLKCPCACLVKN